MRVIDVLLRFCLSGLMLLQGCAGLAVGESKPSSDGRQAMDGRPPAELPMTFRTLGPDQRFSELSSTTAAERLRILRAGEPLSILALSGGGAGGAFGAGAVAGLTRTGARPAFDVVTGVSAGALVAPYAFLGPAWDAQLLEAFTGAAGENLLQSRGLGVIFGSSVYSGRPLQQLIDAYVSDAMIRAVAREAEKGRLLLVATTDVASGESVVWDLGAIARNGGASARTLFRDVLVASASVPGMFPPVIIRVDENGWSQTQAHVDGAATVPFFVPPAFLLTASDTVGARRTAVFVIVDGSLGDAARTTRLTARSILSRSIRLGLSHLLLTTLELTAATAQLDGADLQYSSLPAGYPLSDSLDFSAKIRGPLFRYAYDCAQAGRFWTAFPRAEQDNTPLHGMAQMQPVPCPADDPYFGYFATR
ncbi:MAG TPA: patatin-like phospholipase family protein [Steroidobacteraceae bacterium]|nr:patatin-like phospholipase family protein [Steroidobacteraceae bacterium]